MISPSTQSRALALAGSFATALLVGAFSTAAQAATVTYNLIGSGTEAGSGNYGNSWTFTGSDGSTVKATGYNNSDLFNTNSNFTKAYVGKYLEGLGVTANPGDGDHEIDNSGYVDLIVFQFSQAVRADSVRLNAFGDTDIAVWSGTPNSTPIFTNLAFSTLNSVLTGGSATSGGTSDRTATLSSMVFGTYLVVAAHPNSNDNDGFKIQNLAVTTAPLATPLPAAAPMLASALGLGGFVGWRRKRAQRRAAAAA